MLKKDIGYWDTANHDEEKEDYTQLIKQFGKR
jgi:hypothetical protein